MLFMQELIDGYNLKFNFSCAYKNLTGSILDCTSGITDQTQTIKNIFSIE